MSGRRTVTAAMALRAWMLKNIPDDSDSTDVYRDVDIYADSLMIDREWLRFLTLDEFEVRRLQHVMELVTRDRQEGTVYPPPQDVHRWSQLCRPDAVRVVILGQDPYHEGSASGLAFGTTQGRPIPPSLLNIFKELRRTVPGFSIPADGYLDPWCGQGVLLLNSVFTVIAGRPGSHGDLGWHLLCDKILRKISSRLRNVVFMLWGRFAHAKEYLLDSSKHLILKSCHPSPRVVSAKSPFLGNNHFVLANEYLVSHGRDPVDWTVVCTQV